MSDKKAEKKNRAAKAAKNASVPPDPSLAEILPNDPAPQAAEASPAAAAASGVAAGPDAGSAAAADPVVIQCNRCGATILCNKKDSVAKCEFCKTPQNVIAESKDGTEIFARVADIKTPSAAVAYIEFLFDKYDWDRFAKDSAAFTVPEIDALLDNMKRIAGDQSATWAMCFKYLYTCLIKKTEHILKALSNAVNDFVVKKKYNKAYNDFDSVKESAAGLLARSGEYLRELEDYYQYAQKFGLGKSGLTEIRDQSEILISRLESLKIPAALEDYVEVAGEIAANCAKESSLKFYAKGINADAVYSAAVSAYKAGDFHTAACEFARIKKYGDAEKYLKEINLILKIGPFRMLRDKVFYSKNKMLYPVIGLLKSEIPVAPEDGFVYFFANDYYYRDKSALKYFNIGIESGFVKGNQEIYPKRNSAVFYGELSFPQKLAEKNDFSFDKFVVLVRCSSAAQEQKNQFFARYEINAECAPMSDGTFDLWLWDVKTRRPVLVKQGIIKFKGMEDGVCYYTARKATPENLLKKKRADLDIALFSTDILTGQTVPLVSGDAEIRAYTDNHSIIFTLEYDRQGPDNISIVLKENLAAQEERVIAENVYRYYGYIDGKVFYSVGNSRVQSLWCADLIGGEQREVMRYMTQIMFHDEDYIYTVRAKGGEPYTIYRLPVSGDGSEQVVAFGVRDTVCVEGAEKSEEKYIVKGRLFYRDYNGMLCSVRLNGTGRKELLPEVERVLGIKKNKIYYIAGDDGGVYSLYHMNLDGSARRKIYYNIKAMANYSDDKIVHLEDVSSDNEKELYDGITDHKHRKLIDKTFEKIEKKNLKLDANEQRLNYYYLQAGFSGTYEEINADASDKALLKKLNKKLEKKIDATLKKRAKLEIKTPGLGAEYQILVEYDCETGAEALLAYNRNYPSKEDLLKRGKGKRGGLTS